MVVNLMDIERDSVLTEKIIKGERYIEVLIVLFMTDKLLSFLTLNDNIFPLMDIIY